MVYEILGTGEENAITGKKIAEQLGCDQRQVCTYIERERRAGKPICAIPNGKRAGYFLAKDTAELNAYCGRLLHRGSELFATRRALLNVLKQLEEKKADGAEENGNG